MTKESRRKRLHVGNAIVLALLALLMVIVFGASVGETSIPPEVIAKTIGNKIFAAGFELDPIDSGIVWNYRMSRAVVATCCGAALAVSGVILQSLLRNALADPYLLGISAGASTGAVTVAIIGIGGGLISLSLGAFIGAILAFGLIALLASRAGHLNAYIVLTGVAGSQLFNALTSLIVTKSANADQARGIMFWLLGNLSGMRWSDVWVALPVSVLGFLVCQYHSRALDAFTFGRDSAASLGINVQFVQIVLIGTAAMMTATMVSLVGSIGFVGLVIPHVTRFLFGGAHGYLIPLSALIGAIFLVACDVISRVLLPGQVLPIGVVTALIGAPAFAVILTRLRKNGRC